MKKSTKQSIADFIVQIHNHIASGQIHAGVSSRLVSPDAKLVVNFNPDLTGKELVKVSETSVEINSDIPSDQAVFVAFMSGWGLVLKQMMNKDDSVTAISNSHVIIETDTIALEVLKLSGLKYSISKLISNIRNFLNYSAADESSRLANFEKNL
jgi:hypothetical protein